MSMFNDIDHLFFFFRAKVSCKRSRGYRVREALQVKSLVFLWTWTRKSMVSLMPERTKRSMGAYGQEDDTEV